MMRAQVRVVLLAAVLGCASPPDPVQPPSSPSPTASPSPTSPSSGRQVLRDARLPGGAPTALVLEGGRIRERGPDVVVQAGDTVIDLGGAFVVPGFIDSHVHLAYLPAAEQLADRGLAGVVDLAAPRDFARERALPLQFRWAGPMITSVAGYPTREWGSDGYGIECADQAAALAAVDALVAQGVQVIKLPIDRDRGLDDATLAAVVARAHAAGLEVAAHALSDEDVRRAAQAGVDVLAHTPVEPLSEGAVQAFATRTVISTLAAFGGSSAAVDNLRRLRAAGARVLYGTDFGNTRDPGIQAAELQLLARAGLAGEAIVAAGTADAAAFWGFEGLGTLAVGQRASLLVVSRDPSTDPAVLATPDRVWIDGELR